MARFSASLDATWQKGEDVGSFCLSQGRWGAGIPLQRPEIHQLQMPNHLHPRSPRISSSVAAFLPRTRALGLDSIDGTRWALSRAPSATLPGMRHRTRGGQILPHCGGPASPSHLRLPICQLTLCNHGAGACPPPGTGVFPSCLLPSTSPSSCQQVKQSWGSQCLYFGPQNRKYTVGHRGHGEPTGILGHGGQARGCTAHHRQG